MVRSSTSIISRLITPMIVLATMAWFFGLIDFGDDGISVGFGNDGISVGFGNDSISTWLRDDSETEEVTLKNETVEVEEEIEEVPLTEEQVFDTNILDYDDLLDFDFG